MLKKLFAVCLLVEDFDKSLDFYKKTLGLTVKDQESHFANFKLGGTELAIFGKDEATAMFPSKYVKSGGGSVFGFQVNDVDEACARLKSKGVEIFEGPKITEWGQTVAYFHDPDGNIWEISNK